MALKNTKIVREITQTCNKFLSSKPDLPSPSRTQELPENLHENLQEFRYDVSNTTRSSIIPKVSFSSREPEHIALFEMHHLQPATYPKHIKVNSNPRDEDVWQLHKISDRKYHIQYPTELVKQQKFSLITETYKKNFLKKPVVIGNRHYSMFNNRQYSNSPFMIVSRHYVKKKEMNEKPVKCETQKKKKKCPQGPCPVIAISKDCEKSIGSDCVHRYEDPNCTKKMAPYPSYSESCANELTDSPSECFQCPWKKCGGTESIKPPKRRYHTSVTARPTNTTISNYLMAVKHCDHRKKPCKQPPPKCQKKKKDKCPGSAGETARRKKKCDSNWTEAFALWCAKENVVPNMPLDILETTKIAKLKDENDVRGKFPYDKRQADYEHVKQRPCSDHDPKCKKKKNFRVPDSCENDPYRRCMPDLEKSQKMDLSGKCPDYTPGHPGVDTTIDITMHLIKEHDKGSPPPCEKKQKKSEQCPKKPPKSRNKIERDMDEPFYRKNPKPYPPMPEH